MRLALFISALFSLALTGCRTNNGDIGPLYGLWIMDGMTVDGQPAKDLVANDFSWRFQNNILLIVKQQERYEHLDYPCTWVRQGDRLLLDLTHESYQEVAHDLLLFGHSADLDIVKLTGSTLVLKNDEPGQTVTYTLRKSK